MYDSLKPWVNVPVEIKPFLKRSGTGDKEFGPQRSATCYPQGDVKVVRNSTGVEVVSNTQLIFDGIESINEMDEIIFDGKIVTIHAVSTFYRNGMPDIRVVYV